MANTDVTTESTVPAHAKAHPRGVMEAHRRGSTLAMWVSSWNVIPGHNIEMYAEQLETVPTAWADYGAVPPRSIEAALHDPEAVLKRVNKTRQHPIDEFGGFKEWFEGSPEFEYYIHVDASKVSDNTGIAMCHYDMEEDKTILDLIHFIPAGNTDWELSFERIRHFLHSISDRGFTNLNISFDGWQSMDMLEYLVNKGFAAELYSVDRTTGPYDTLISGILTNRVDFYVHALFMKEMKALKLIKGKKYEHPAEGCFSADTRIALLDGTSPTIEELTDRGDFWVYSMKKDGSVVPGKARARKTKYVTEMLDVVLDSGSVVRCTPEHPWMMSDGTYKKASQLQPIYDSVMPLYRSWQLKSHGAEHEKLRSAKQPLVFTHQLVADACGLPRGDGLLIHHEDGNPFNNTPENLESLTKKEHTSLHGLRRHKKDARWREKLALGTARFNNSPEGKRKHSEALKLTNANMTPEQRKARARARKDFRSDITLDRIVDVARKLNPQNAGAAAKLLKCGRNVVIRVLSDHGYESWESFQSNLTVAAPRPQRVNHRIREIIPVTLPEPVPVYDLEVDEWHNFALTAGVFVHNSKDVSDSVAGCVSRCMISLIGLSVSDSLLAGSVGDFPHVHVTVDNDNPKFQSFDSFPGRRRVVRIDSTEHHLIMAAGYKDPQTSHITNDLFLVWDEPIPLPEIVDTLSQLAHASTIELISMNESVPLEIINYAQQEGIRVSSALVLTKTPGFSRAMAVTSKSFRVLVQTLRKGLVTLPRHPRLLRDLHYMTSDNQMERVYARTLAGLVEQCLKEYVAGTMGKTMPMPVAARATQPVQPASIEEHRQSATPTAKPVQRLPVGPGTMPNPVRG